MVDICAPVYVCELKFKIPSQPVGCIKISTSSVFSYIATIFAPPAPTAGPVKIVEYPEFNVPAKKLPNSVVGIVSLELST